AYLMLREHRELHEVALLSLIREKGLSPVSGRTPGQSLRTALLRHSVGYDGPHAVNGIRHFVRSAPATWRISNEGRERPPDVPGRSWDEEEVVGVLEQHRARGQGFSPSAEFNRAVE